MSITGIRWAGPRALLVELSDLASVLAFHSRLLAKPLPGQLDAVAAAATVLLKFGTHAEALAARTAVGHVDLREVPQNSTREVTIEVVYDGEDLAEVGMLTGLGADGVVAAHTGQLWTAAFGGFAPGFAYLLGENHSLDVPRRASPRTTVPAGSVALGGTFSAVYPRRSPGGWQLIGRTTAVLWDLERESPALVRPGDRVRYVAVREAVSLKPAPRVVAEEVTGPALVVGSPGLQSLIQDLGRPGLGDLGVSAAGAVDQQSARQANRLVGNQPDAAVVETVLGGLTVQADGDHVLAIAGALVPLEIRDASGAPARRAAMCVPFALLDGETLSLGAPTLGARSYLAVRGGLDVQPVLGSRSSDSMSGIGPAPLSAGSRLPVGKAPLFQMVGAPEESTLRVGAAYTELRITLGPRDDWFDTDSLKSLVEQNWVITEQSNRIGVRLAPGGNRALERKGAQGRGAGELPSEGAVAGSLQVPPTGHPVLFLADHPVTGGYPVIAVVVPEDLPSAAQLRPGHSVRFTIVDPATLEPLEPAATGVVPEGTQP